MSPVPGNPFDVALNPGFPLGRKQAGSVTGTVYVPSLTPDGVYELLPQPTVDGVPADPVKLSIELNRNLLINPGFELSIKEGWYSTTSAPSTDAHSGISALQLKRGNVRTIDYMFATR